MKPPEDQIRFIFQWWFHEGVSWQKNWPRRLIHLLRSQVESEGWFMWNMEKTCGFSLSDTDATVDSSEILLFFSTKRIFSQKLRSLFLFLRVLVMTSFETCISYYYCRYIHRHIHEYIYIYASYIYIYNNFYIFSWYIYICIYIYTIYIYMIHVYILYTPIIHGQNMWGFFCWWPLRLKTPLSEAKRLKWIGMPPAEDLGNPTDFPHFFNLQNMQTQFVSKPSAEFKRFWSFFLFSESVARIRRDFS